MSVILSFNNTIVTSMCWVICILVEFNRCPNVPHTFLGCLNPPPQCFLGQTQESAYHLNHNVSRGGCHTMINKITD